MVELEYHLVRKPSAIESVLGKNEETLLIHPSQKIIEGVADWINTYYNNPIAFYSEIDRYKCVEVIIPDTPQLLLSSPD